MSPIDEPFEWDHANVTHLARHGITPLEAEEVIQCSPLVESRDFRSGEIRRREIGETAAGRVLFVVSVARGYKIRVVTAWHADRDARAEWQSEKERRRS